MTGSRLAGLLLLLPLACTDPARLGWPAAVSSAGTALLARAKPDATHPDGDLRQIDLRLLDVTRPFHAALVGDDDHIELALFEAGSSALHLPSPLQAVSPEQSGAVHLPLDRASHLYSNHLLEGVPGAWVEDSEPPPVLAGSYVMGLPESCGPIEADAIELWLPNGEPDLSGVNFVARVGSGEALIGTASAAYRLSDGQLSQWRIEPEPILSARIQAGANYKTAYVADVGGQIWLGGFRGLLERYDPIARSLSTETASKAGLPTWRALEGNPDGSELFAGGVYDDHGSFSIVIAELERGPGDSAQWLTLPLGPSDEPKKAVALAYEAPHTALVSRESATLLRYNRGAVTIVPTVWDTPVIYRLARGPEGILIAAAVGERASFGLFEPDGGFTGLGQAAFTETYMLRPLGRGFVFSGSAGWVGMGGSVAELPQICGRRLNNNAQQKRAMDVLGDDRFLVGGDAYRDEPASLYRVRLLPAP